MDTFVFRDPSGLLYVASRPETVNDCVIPFPSCELMEILVEAKKKVSPAYISGAYVARGLNPPF